LNACREMAGSDIAHKSYCNAYRALLYSHRGAAQFREELRIKQIRAPRKFDNFEPHGRSNFLGPPAVFAARVLPFDQARRERARLGIAHDPKNSPNTLARSNRDREGLVSDPDDSTWFRARLRRPRKGRLPAVCPFVLLPIDLELNHQISCFEARPENVSELRSRYSRRIKSVRNSLSARDECQQFGRRQKLTRGILRLPAGSIFDEYVAL